MCSAGDIAAWNEALSRHAGDLDKDDDLDEDQAMNKDVPTYLDRNTAE